MAALTDAVVAATAPYRGFTYYAGGNQYYDPTQTAAYINDLNDKFKLNLTPAEIADGIKQFGDSHRQQFGNPVSAYNHPTTWANQNGIGNFTNLSDPLAIARESIANVLRTRSIPEATIQSSFYAPLQTLSTNSTAEYQKAADGLAQAQMDSFKAVTPGFMQGGGGFGDIIGELLSDPVVIGMLGVAIGGSGILSNLGEVGSLAAADAAAGLIPAADLAAMTGTTAGITGNAAIDTYLSNLPSSMARNAAIQLVKNGDIDLGQLATGAVVGGLNAYGNSLVSDLGLDPSIAKGLTSAVVGTGVGLISGQDVGSALTGGLISGAATGVGNAVGTAVRDNMVDSEITNAAAQNNTVVDGEQAFSDNPVEPVQPPPVDTSTGGFSDLVSDLVSPNTAGSIAGTVAGNATGAVLADAATGNQNAAPITDTAVEPDTPIASVSFSSVLPQNVTDAERTTDWTGTRLMDAGRI